jgi:hypothetical protein
MMNAGLKQIGGKASIGLCQPARARSINSMPAVVASGLPGFKLTGSGVAHPVQCSCGSCGGKHIDERHLSSASSPGATNRGVIFMGPNHVEVKSIPFPKLELDSTDSPVVSERQKRTCPHGAILKVVTTNICGSDQHMVRGRTSLPGGHMVLGHEITGQVVEAGPGCEFVNVGDICSVPFNIACGRCAACKRGSTSHGRSCHLDAPYCILYG